MKLFRISNPEEFFNSYPNAVEMFKDVSKKFEDNINDPPRFFFLGIEKRFADKPVNARARLSHIVFLEDYEVYNYKIEEKV
jgi:hypothetical protein